MKEKRQVHQENEDENISDDVKELRRLQKLIYAIEYPEEIQKKLAECMPAEYQQEWEDLKKKREASYRMSLYAAFTMAVAVLTAVVTLIFSVWYSYIALTAGLIIICLIRHYR